MIVYKYRPVDKYTLELLINNEFHLSFPEEFNDPFDSCVSWDFQATAKKYIEFIHASILIPQEIKENTIRAILNNNFDFSFFNKYGLEKEKKNKEFLIFSGSKINNNILLWSHYANCHKGIAFGFNSEIKDDLNCLEFDEVVDFKDSLNGNFAAIHEVTYKNIETKFRFFYDNDEQHANILGNKSPDWKYEEELRIMFLSKSFLQDGFIKQKIKFTKKILNKVIFGLKTSEEDKSTIRTIIKDKGYDVKFFKCERKKNEYGLNIVPDIDA